MLSFVHKCLFAIILIWVLISVVRLFYNLTKIFTEERSWFFISDENRRQKAYGDIEIIYKKIDSLATNNDCVLLDSKNEISYFLLRYLLYPKRIYWVNSPSEAINHSPSQCKYILLYNHPINKFSLSLVDKKEQQLKKISEFSSSVQSNNASVLYQIK